MSILFFLILTSKVLSFSNNVYDIADGVHKNKHVYIFYFYMSQGVGVLIFGRMMFLMFVYEFVLIRFYPLWSIFLVIYRG